jgi:hypothetical protein
MPQSGVFSEQGKTLTDYIPMMLGIAALGLFVYFILSQNGNAPRLPQLPAPGKK